MIKHAWLVNVLLIAAIIAMYATFKDDVVDDTVTTPPVKVVLADGNWGVVNDAEAMGCLVDVLKTARNTPDLSDAHLWSAKDMYAVCLMRRKVMI